MQNMPKIDYADAKQGLELIIEKAEQMQKAVAIAVADSQGNSSPSRGWMAYRYLRSRLR